MEEQVKIKKKTSKGTKKTKSKFWFGYRIYVGVLALLFVVMCIAVWNTMKKYEAAQPEKYVDKVVQKIEDGNFEDVTYTSGADNKFEPNLDYKKEFESLVAGKELDFKISADSYDSLKPKYDILIGEEKVATVNLKSVKEYKKMAILVLSEWEVDSIVPVVKAGNYEIEITLPMNYEAEINGIKLTDEELSGNAVEMEGFDYVKEYVEAPKTVTYVVKGLANVPELKVNGEVIASDKLTVKGNKYSYTADYKAQEIPAELRDYVLNAAKKYSNYFSRDLEGCRESTAPIADIFPAGSYYIQMAEKYRQEDMWMYSAHSAPVFTNEKVSNYIVYSEDCFSVEVAFDKTMVLTLNGNERLDQNNQVYYYVKIDGKWLIADMHNI